MESGGKHCSLIACRQGPRYCSFTTNSGTSCASKQSQQQQQNEEKHTKIKDFVFQIIVFCFVCLFLFVCLFFFPNVFASSVFKTSCVAPKVSG